MKTYSIKLQRHLSFYIIANQSLKLANVPFFSSDSDQYNNFELHWVINRAQWKEKKNNTENK